MSAFNNLPNYPTKLVDGPFTNKDWYLFWANLFKGVPPAQVLPVTVGASPFTYTAPVKGFILLTGGTVSAVEFSRDGTTFYSYGATAGQFQLNSQDQIRVTYTVTPTMTLVPT